MIEYKTAVLVGASLKMGAIVAGAPGPDADAIYDFGRELGIAFQIQDDYLDAFGDPESFGKQVGGDIIENKKTYLLIKAREFADGAQRQQLEHLYSINPNDNAEKIASVKSVFEKTGAKAAAQDAIKAFTEKALSRLENIGIDEKKKEVLRQFASQLMERQA
jgi:geranylgeranyl diphosphate synthase type II